MPKLRFSLVLHNHQPVGNFDDVIERAFADSYRPFLDVIDGYPDLPFCLHTSGCLMEWLASRRPEYVSRLRAMAASGQVEILGGGYYEPILTMIPSRDRLGQIRGYTEYLRELLDCDVRGMWLPERVWEQSLTKDIVDAGMNYTILDDHHFQNAGVPTDSLHGYYITEDQGRLLRIFPGSEPARYMIPFGDVSEVMRYLRTIHDQHPNAIVVFADDGEKFGTWPDTKAHVYEHGWLTRFFEALRHNRDWIEVTTLSKALDALPAMGQIHLPDCSYREMTEWSLDTDAQLELQRSVHELNHHPWGDSVKRRMRGGSWRNFKSRYPETREMYARMMEISQRIDRLTRTNPEAFGDARVCMARRDLYRSQCNCAYWHGAFGGLYLPHLRGAVYQNLIKADNLLSEFDSDGGKFRPGVIESDWNLDGHVEVRMADESIVAYVSPRLGGRIYELDVRDVAVNLGACLGRRPEAYHERIRNHAHQNDHGHAQSIHERVRFKQEGLDRALTYDRTTRGIFVDHFLDGHATLEQWPHDGNDLGDFQSSPFDIVSIRERPVPSVTLRRNGRIDGLSRDC